MIGNVDFSALSTSALPTRVSEVVKAAAIEQLKEIKGLRQYCLVDRSQEGEGVQKYIYWVYDDLTAAYDRKELEDFKYDTVGATQSTVDFVEIAKGFQISWESDNLKRLPIRAAQTRAAVREVQDREDSKIVAALIASSAVTSSVTATGVLSGTTADPVKDIAQAKRKIKALGYLPDQLWIEEENLEELLAIIASNDWQQMTARAIESGVIDMFMKLKIVSLPSTKLTHGTAMVIKSGADGCYQLGVAKDLTTKMFDDEENHSTKVQVFETVAPAVVRPDAGAKITGW